MTPPRFRAGDRADALLGDPRALPVAALLLALLVHAPHLSNGFAWDDLGFLVQNPTVNGAGPWSDVFTRDAWWALQDRLGSRVLYYRPLFVALCRVLWAVGSGSPVPFHLAALGLHLGAALLGARLAVGLGAPRAAAAAGALLFMVHPLAGEAVYWSSAVGEAALLCAALGTVLALRAAREAAAPARRALLQAGAAACSFAALGVKETGFVVPLLASVEALAAPRGEWRARLLGTWPAWLPIVPWIVLRRALFGSGGVALALQDPVARLARAGEVLAWDLRRLLYPFPLSPGHQLPRGAGPAAGLAALAAVAAGVLGLLWRRPRAGAWAVAVLLPLAPPLAQGFLSLQTELPVAERYLYLSLLPFLAGAAWAIRELGTRVAWPPGAPAAGVAALLAIAAAASAWYGRHFDGNDAYFARILAIYPGDPVALSSRGQRALADGDAARALVDFEAALRAEPGRALAHLNVALARERLGDRVGAEAAARGALERDAGIAVGHAILARLLRDQGRLADAGPHFEAAARLSPDDPGARADYGTWLFIAGDVAGAARQWEEGLQRDPGRCELLFNVAMARAALGRAPGARAAAERFLDGCREGWGAQRARAAAWAGR